MIALTLRNIALENDQQIGDEAVFHCIRSLVTSTYKLPSSAAIMDSVVLSEPGPPQACH
jgi:hypothetical protein